MPSSTFTASVLGTPDPRGLARFYRQLLGWPIRDDTDEWATLRPADGSTGLSFQLERDHVPPVWPPEPGAQQMQQHLDFLVDGVPQWMHMASLSHDGLRWSSPVPLLDAPVTDEVIYLTLDSGGPDQRMITGDSFDIYRTRSSTPYRWDDAWLERVHVTFDLEPSSR